MISLTFTPNEFNQLQGATQQWLMEMQKTQIRYDLKILETLEACTSLHRKVLEAKETI